MPLFSSILWLVANLCLALGINWIAKELELINHSELMTLYFMLAAFRIYDAQTKFSLAYQQNPDAVEQMMREQLNKD